MSELQQRLGRPATYPPECGGPWWRRAMRRVTLDALAWNMSRHPVDDRPRVVIALLHHVTPDEEQPFRDFLQRASRAHDLISYDEAVRRVHTNNFGPRPALAVSFDDGFRCNLVAASILEEFGTTGAFFVCPPVHDERDAAVLEQFCRQQLWHGPVDFLTWDDVESLHARGHVIGGHTQSHVHLGTVSDAQASDEIGSSYDALKHRLGAADHFAWPYGTFAHFTPHAARAVFDAGYTTCASGVRGCHITHSPLTTDHSPLCLRRESLEARWPASHLDYFLHTSAARGITSDATWPTEYAFPQHTRRAA